MICTRHDDRFAQAIARVAVVLAVLSGCLANAGTSKQQSLDQWRELTAPAAAAPRVFVNGNQVRFFFNTQSNVVEFEADWNRRRVPSDSYAVNSALLHWSRDVARVPDLRRSWREAVVIAGAEWRQLSTNLVEELTPSTPGHGAYYQAFLGNRLFFRNALGDVRSTPQGDAPEQILIDHRYSVDETLDVLSVKIEEQLIRSHPGCSLFVIMAPDGGRFT